MLWPVATQAFDMGMACLVSFGMFTTLGKTGRATIITEANSDSFVANN